VIFRSPWISLAERSRSRFALAVFCVQVRNCFLLPAIPSRVASGKSKPARVGLRTGIPRLRMSMDDISRGGSVTKGHGEKDDDGF
jgi:hypothetical protein